MPCDGEVSVGKYFIVFLVCLWQIELDKTAEDFRRAHVERQELISQWENTIEQMQRRDKEMDLLAAQLARTKMEVRKKEEQIQEKQQFLDNEHDNNSEKEKKIVLCDRNLAKLRLEFQEAETQRFQFSDEVICFSTVRYDNKLTPYPHFKMLSTGVVTFP